MRAGLPRVSLPTGTRGAARRTASVLTAAGGATRNGLTRATCMRPRQHAKGAGPLRSILTQRPRRRQVTSTARRQPTLSAACIASKLVSAAAPIDCAWDFCADSHGCRRRLKDARHGTSRSIGGEGAPEGPGGDKKPWFMAVGFVRPHLPFVCPRRFWEAATDPGEPPPDLGPGASKVRRMSAP